MASQADMRSLTLGTCINFPLPRLDPKSLHTSKNTLAKSSGKLTQATDPPRVLLLQRDDSWNTAGELALRQALPNRTLQTHHIASTFAALKLGSETGVVNAPMLYLLHSVFEVLQVKYGNQFVVRSEMSSEEPGEEEELPDSAPLAGIAAPESTKRSVRFDMVFQTADNRVVAILEFKRRGLIQRSDYAEATLPFNASGATIRQLLERSNETQKKTLLARNAYVFSMQIAAYAIVMSCRHVALFNWDHLLLFNFHQLNSRKGTVGDLARYTWVNEHMQQSKVTIRNFFLGWLVNAFEEKWSPKKRN